MKKKKTLKEKIWKELEFCFQINIALIFFTIFFMGALGNYYDIPKEILINNSVGNLTKASEILISNMIRYGYNHPHLTTFVFIFCIFFAFIYPFFNIINLIIKDKKLKGGTTFKNA